MALSHLCQDIPEQPKGRCGQDDLGADLLVVWNANAQIRRAKCAKIGDLLKRFPCLPGISFGRRRSFVNLK